MSLTSVIEQGGLDFSSTLQMPMNIDAEQIVLGSALLDDSAMQKLFDFGMEIKHFYKPAHRHIFTAMSELHLKEKTTDLVTVASALNDAKLLDAVGGIAYLSVLVDCVVSTSNILNYALLIWEKWYKRNLAEKLQWAFSELLGDATKSIADIQENIGATLNKAIDESIEKDLDRKEEYLKKEWFDSAIELFCKGEEAKDLFLNTGLIDLDDKAPLKQGELCLVAARPSMGKTAFSLALGKNIHERNQNAGAIIFFSAEMSYDLLATRIISADTGLNSNLLRPGSSLTPEQMEQVFESYAKWLERKPEFIINDIPSSEQSVLKMWQKLKFYQKKFGKIGAIIVDYMQLLVKGEETTRTQELGNIARALKAMARQYQCPVICLSQLNRNVEQRTNKRPMLSDLRESGEIEEASDVVLMLYRDDAYNPDTIDRNILEVNIAKNRNGATGLIKLLYTRHNHRILNLASNI